MLPSRPSTSFQSQTKRNAPASGVGFGELAPLTKEQVIHANLDIRDIRERILATKKLRIDLARSVHWQREEHLRIEKKLGIDPHMDASEPPQNVHEWGVGGRTWEKDWGRLPTSLEWKNMLCTSRFQWDENGTRRGIGAIR